MGSIVASGTPNSTTAGEICSGVWSTGGRARVAERLGDKVQRRSNFLPSSKTHMKKTYHDIARIYPEVLATT